MPSLRKNPSSITSHTFNKTSLLWKWASHHDESFYDFPEDEALQIREELLRWYRANRRKLPWRGDPPPYDGSTAGINNKNSKPRKNSKNNPGQRSIETFFGNVSKVKGKEKSRGRFPKGTEIKIENSLEVLPSENVTAYGIWVSEIMLQQTRVEAVIPYYLKWMKRFPTVTELANASEEDVNAHWAGLGFYRRARLLHSGAKLVVEKYQGDLPETVEGLMEINGIGKYTASAIASIAFGKCVPVVDGNVCRVLSRLRGIAGHIKAPMLKDKLGWKLAEQVVEAGDGQNAGEVNQALMELGATYCAPSGTGIDPNDPLKKFYMSTKLARCFKEEYQRITKLDGKFSVDNYIHELRCEDSSSSSVLWDLKASILTGFYELFNQGPTTPISHGPFPLPPPKSTKREEVLAVAVQCMIDARSEDKRYLLVRRPEDGLLAGQWEFPAVCLWSSDNKEKKKNPKKRSREAPTVPFIEESVRSMALNDYLCSLVNSTVEIEVAKKVQSGSRILLQEPKEHIFSHVRHTMWIEYQYFLREESSEIITSWTASNGKSVRWMTTADMKLVGLTSGVKKVLKAVTSSSSSGTKVDQGKKRRKVNCSYNAKLKISRKHP